MLVTTPTAKPSFSSLLQQRTLLDVQFDKPRIVSIVQPHLVEGAMEARSRAQLGQRVAFGISEVRVRGAIQPAAQHPAPQASEAEARRFFGGKEQ
jgi:hypothetical protein